MLNRFLLALGTLTITIAPVQALPTQSFELLGNLTAAGGRYYVDSDACAKYPVYGLARGWVIHICKKFHDGNVNELTDTVRHEVWHVIQACNSGPLLYDLDSPVG